MMIISQEQNYANALQLVAAGKVSPNGLANHYYIEQRDDRGYPFQVTASTPTEDAPAGWCHCPAWYDVGRKRRPAIRCTHMIAAEIFEQAQSFIRAWIHRNQSTLQHLIAIAHLQLEYAEADLVAGKFQAIIATARKMMVTDRHLSKRYPVRLDQVQMQIERHQESVASIKTRLRREPENRITQEELRYCADALNELKSRKARIVKGWNES